MHTIIWCPISAYFKNEIAEKFKRLFHLSFNILQLESIKLRQINKKICNDTRHQHIVLITVFNPSKKIVLTFAFKIFFNVRVLTKHN